MRDSALYEILEAWKVIVKLRDEHEQTLRKR